MAPHKNSIEKELCHLFPSDWLRDQAEASGVIERERKIDPVALFWTLILGVGYGERHSIANLRRAYQAATGTPIARSSFYDRFTPEFEAFLKVACDRALGTVQDEDEALKAMLSDFKDLLITDATVLRLHDMLSRLYPANRINHTQAAAKLHLVYSVLGVSEQRIRLTGERKHESSVFTAGPWVRDCLLLFDLGFFKYALLDRIDQHGGCFISRLKSNCNPKIVAVHQGSENRLVGRKVMQVLTWVRRDVLDVEVEVSFKKRAYKGKRRSLKRRFRVVGIKNKTTKEYHLYITNIAPDVLSSEAIAKIYSVRWLVELVFKQLKSFYHLEKFNTTNTNILHALIYSALITMVVSQTIERVLQKAAAQQDQDAQAQQAIFPLLRLAAVLTAYCGELLKAVLRYAGVKQRPLGLLDLLLKEARDPNRNRPTLPEQLDLITRQAA